MLDLYRGKYGQNIWATFAIFKKSPGVKKSLNYGGKVAQSGQPVFRTKCES
jgi:hypothetical protein